MLNIDRLLKMASGAQMEPDPTRPDQKNSKSGQQNPRQLWPDPAGSGHPTKKTAFAAEQTEGARLAPFFEPLPGRYWIDPVVNGFRPNYETIQDRRECLGYPAACLRCRLLMADLETCLLL